MFVGEHMISLCNYLYYLYIYDSNGRIRSTVRFALPFLLSKKDVGRTPLKAPALPASSTALNECLMTPGGKAKS